MYFVSFISKRSVIVKKKEKYKWLFISMTLCFIVIICHNPRPPFECLWKSPGELSSPSQDPLRGMMTICLYQTVAVHWRRQYLAPVTWIWHSLCSNLLNRMTQQGLCTCLQTWNSIYCFSVFLQHSSRISGVTWCRGALSSEVREARQREERFFTVTPAQQFFYFQYFFTLTSSCCFDSMSTTVPCSYSHLQGSSHTANAYLNTFVLQAFNLKAE